MKLHDSRASSGFLLSNPGSLAGAADGETYVLGSYTYEEVAAPTILITDSPLTGSIGGFEGFTHVTRVLLFRSLGITGIIGGWPPAMTGVLVDTLGITTQLPAFPATVQTITLSNSLFTTLPNLPASLTYLDINDQSAATFITGLPAIPAGVYFLDCSTNRFTTAAVDAALSQLVANGLSGAYTASFAGALMADPTDGLLNADALTLVGRGWTVTVHSGQVGG